MCYCQCEYYLIDVDKFHKNHSKLGVCLGDNNKVIVGGNNHSIATQGARGGMFVVIDNEMLSSGLKCLLRQDSKFY